LHFYTVLKYNDLDKKKSHVVFTVIFFLLGLTFSFVARGQNATVLDRLLSELGKPSQPDTTKVNTLIKVSSYYYGNNPSKMLDYGLQAVEIAQKVNFKIGLAKAYRQCGIAKYTQGNFKDASDFFSKALATNEQIDNKAGIIACLSNLGSVNMVQNNYPLALDYFQKAIRKGEQINDQLTTGISYGNIGVIYSELKNYEMALKHFQGGLDIHTKINYGIGIATGLGNVGNVYFKMKNYPKALEYYQKALEKNIALDSKFNMAREYGNVANAQSELKQYQLSFANFQKALQLNEDLKNKKGIAVNLQGIGNYYYLLGKYGEALDYIKRANSIAKEVNVFDVQKETYSTLSDIYEKIGKLDSAYVNFKRFIAVKDQIENEDKQKQVTRLEMKYEFDSKEEKYKNEQLLSNERLNQQQLMLDLNQSKLNESIKERDLVRLNYLKTQSELKSEQLEKKAKEKQLTIAEREKDIQLEKSKSLLQTKKLNELRIKQLWLYGVLTIIGLAAILSFFINHYRIKSLKAKNDLNKHKVVQLEEEFRLKNSVREAEMQSLRSQMNPHFIFNTLNSINSYIIENKREIASEYLTTFSKLMRHILDLSKHDMVTLDKEISALKLYIELEALRLENKFDYSISIDENLALEMIKIPPLIIQPFVENAIWHGLHNKKNYGHIFIRIKDAGDNQLLVVVEDDGIGRVASGALKKQQVSHKSYGIEITINRIKLLDENNSVEIIDLYSNEKIAIGTRVEIKLNGV
jgi:tetratricopeptide (TPR) repeat protein